MNKGFLGKISLFSVIFLAFTIVLIFNIKPVSSDVYPGDLRPLYGDSICGGNQCPAWVNLTRGDMFFANGNQVFVVINSSCTSPSACNASMNVTGNFSQIGGSGSRAGVFKQNAPDGYSWAIFELNDTVNFSAITDAITMTPKNITLNVTDANTSIYYSDTSYATVILVNMSTPPGCPTAGSLLPPAVPLLNGTVVNVTSDCWTNCTVDDHAQQYNSTYYVLCGPTFGVSSTNFTDVAANGNFSNFHFVLDIPGKVKINFTQNVSMDTQQKSQSLFEFAMKNMMSGGRIGINETEWNGVDTTKPNLTLSAALTIYNFSGRFGIPSTRRPSIARRATYGIGSFSPCPSNICSGTSWDGQNLTFSVTGFSEYSVETGLSMVLSNTTGVSFNPTTNISYTNTRNVNFSYTPTWNSTVNPQAVRLWGNFTTTWAVNVTNTTVLTNATPNYINNTVDADGAYIWNAVINDTTGGNDTNTANWTIVVDTVTPSWFTNQSSTPANYSSTLSLFNITWNDSVVGISTVLITILNFTGGVLINNASMSNATYTGSIYNYSIVLPAGTFNWTSYANDSAGNWNVSSTWNFTINNATPDVKIFIDDLTANKTINYSTSVTIKGNSTNTTTPPTFNLYVFNVTNSSPAINMLLNNTTSTIISTLLLGNGTYQIVYNTTGNSNYSSAENNTLYLMVNQNTTSLTLRTYIDDLPSNKTINYSTSVTITGNSTNINPPTLYLYVFNVTNSSPAVSTLINSSISPTISTLTLGNGTYQIVYNTTGNANYSSSASNNSTLYLLVNQNSTNPVVLTINNGTAYTNQDVRITSGTSITATCSNTYSNSGTCYLYRDGVDKSGTETVSLPSGTYTYKANITENANYSSNATGASYTLTVVAASSSGGGGSSSGGGSTTPSVTIKLAKGNANVTVTTIASGKSATASIAKYQDVAIREVNITVSNSVNNIKIVILKLPGLPASVSHEISGKVYHYISIDKTNFTNADINKIYFKFAVNKTWFTNNNVDYSNVTLYRWNDNTWDSLTTTKVEEGTDEIFYKAEAVSLSYFAIGTNPTLICGNGVCESTETQTSCPQDCGQAPSNCTESWSCTNWSACVNGTKTRTCTDANSCGTTSNKPTETGTCQVEEESVSEPTGWSTESVVITVVAIIAIVAIALIGNKKKLMPFISKLAKKEKKTQYVYKKQS